MAQSEWRTYIVCLSLQEASDLKSQFRSVVSEYTPRTFHNANLNTLIPYLYGFNIMTSYFFKCAIKQNIYSGLNYKSSHLEIKTETWSPLMCYTASVKLKIILVFLLYMYVYSVFTRCADRQLLIELQNMPNIYKENVGEKRSNVGSN